MLRKLFCAAAATLLVASPVMATDPSHYKGEPALSLEQAMANFSDSNTRLESILSGDLTPETMNDVHQLTYTLENALEKMDDELDDLAETLERVHQASEYSDPDTVRSAGKQYLNTSRQIIK